MTPTELPDELLEKIFILAIARDVDGRIARAVYCVSRRWKRIISPMLYRNLAYFYVPEDLPHQEAHITPKNTFFRRWKFRFSHQRRRSRPPPHQGSARLFRVLEVYPSRVHILHLMIKENFIPAKILRKLAAVCHTTLRTLTIWPDAEMDSRLRFFDETTVCFPQLKVITFVGNIRVRQDMKPSRAAGPPRFPLLTSIHLVGSILIPPLAHSYDVPLLSTVRYSHLTFNDASIVLRKLGDGRRYQYLASHLGDFSRKLLHSLVYHAPPLDVTDEAEKEVFLERVKVIQDLLKEPWARGYTISIHEDSIRTPYSRDPQDSWDSVIHRLAEDEP
ncbi:hypothetical protein DL96DRAFT_1627370 [Flagelloscypha sp. PMI_526]|nr:hypothetical protein DL96DRAFT_1627370 [Flagelloscypha sp. PMI_526]